MRFENVTLELGTTGFDICTVEREYEYESSTIARFNDAFNLRGVDVTVDDKYLTVYGKDGATIMQVTIYKNKQEPGEE